VLNGYAKRLGDVAMVVATGADLGNTIALEQRLDGVLDEVALLCWCCVGELSEGSAVVPLVQKPLIGNTIGGQLTHTVPALGGVVLVLLAA
jgi:hypothetical protein